MVVGTVVFGHFYIQILSIRYLPAIQDTQKVELEHEEHGFVQF